MLNLLLRFYDPSQGAVLIDGTDLRDAALDSLRQQTAVVFQENFLFNMSIRENIRLGRPDATDTEIESAARDAEIHDFILSLPDGYDTLAGERGSRFSGGQRQRLAIARAVLRRPAILILDEATSALDPTTEAAVNKTFSRIASGRTVISITHRLSSVTAADWIYVMHQGQIAEQGRHDELAAAGGRYSSMWRRQSGLHISEEGAGVDAKWLSEMPLVPECGPVDAGGTGHSVRHRADPRRSRHHPRGRSRRPVLHLSSGARRKCSNPGTRAAVLQDGDYFGEIALLSNQPRNATVRSLTPCVCLILQRDHFRAMLDRSAPLRERIQQVMKSRE